MPRWSQGKDPARRDQLPNLSHPLPCDLGQFVQVERDRDLWMDSLTIDVLFEVRDMAMRGQLSRRRGAHLSGVRALLPAVIVGGYGEVVGRCGIEISDGLHGTIPCID